MWDIVQIIGMNGKGYGWRLVHSRTGATLWFPAKHYSPRYVQRARAAAQTMMHQLNGDAPGLPELRSTDGTDTNSQRCADDVRGTLAGGRRAASAAIRALCRGVLRMLRAGRGRSAGGSGSPYRILG